MVTTKELLSKIQNGVYGKDIRQAISDALRQVFIDANMNINVNDELVQARGEYQTLAERLDAINSNPSFDDDVEILEEKTYTPSTTNIIIKANTFLKGDQLIAGDPNLLAKNIKQGVEIFGVVGTCKPDDSQPDDSTQTTIQTVVLIPDSYRTYRSTVYNNWTTDDYCRQGEYKDSNGKLYGDCNGCMFFSNKFEVLKGKTINKIELTVTRQTGAGGSAAVEFVFQGHGHENQPSGMPSYTPCNATLSLTQGQTGTVTITDSTILEGIKAGTIKGFGIKSDYDYEHYGNLQNANCKIYYQDTVVTTIAKIKIIVDNVNVRSGPSTSYNYIGIAKLNEEYEIIEQDSATGWYKIKYNGGQGWITNKTAYVSVISGSVIQDNTSSTPGEDTGSGLTTLGQKRSLILARAKSIVNDCINGLAWYSQYWRTYDYNNKITIKGTSETVLGVTYQQTHMGDIGYDCSSYAGVCYQAAGITYLMNKSCAAGTLQSALKEHSAMMWRYKNQDSLTKLRSGDLIIRAKDGSTVTDNNMATVATRHVMIFDKLSVNAGYVWVYEANGYSKGIIYNEKKMTSSMFFARPVELSTEDSQQVSAPTTPTGTEEYHNCFSENGIINGNSYIYKFKNARFTCYYSSNSFGGAGAKLPVKTGHTVAANNIPYGTKLYVPQFDGYKIVNDNGDIEILDGIFITNDCGVGCFDLDVFMGRNSNQCLNNMKNPMRGDIYVLEWGAGYGSAWSFTASYKWAYEYWGSLSRFKTAFNNYIVDDGTLINFTKFKTDDKDIRNSTYWNMLNS